MSGPVGRVDFSAGKPTDKGVYVRVQEDPAVKVAAPESFEKLTGNETDFIETAENVESETTEP